MLFFFVRGNEARQIMFFLLAHSCTRPYQGNLSGNMKASLPTRPARNTFMGWGQQKKFGMFTYNFCLRKSWLDTIKKVPSPPGMESSATHRSQMIMFYLKLMETMS